ncbi:MAG: hypothetical protein HKM93_19115 [Desulfobacteraceae bacterium]|nr:hypothetical protein [Desulfobacteraceae bacterium]
MAEYEKTTLDIIVTLIIVTLAFLLSGRFDVLEQIVDLSRQYEAYELDEVFSASVVLACCMLVFAFRRIKEINNTKNIIANKNQELLKVLEEIKTLRGIIPICSYCKKIRDEKGAWDQMETYIQTHSLASFSHGLCPECFEKQMGKI